uniref:Uncharacterized protein n=1 Tax=Acrobeloides nanus TaxID=290746 RepID=A0A914CAV6_9BILA
MMFPPPCFTVGTTCSRKEECGGMRNYHKYMVPTVKHGGGSIIVWDCFYAFEVGPLVRADGIVEAADYRDALENHMLPFSRRTFRRGWTFMQDNDPKHGSPHVARSSLLMRA